jgi:trehalose 6-phosphate synthase/phosphatase
MCFGICLDIVGCLAKQVMLGVDRLDMIKGIPQKLLAFEMFLEKNPEWREKVLLVQIAVPTRTDVHECRPLGLHVLMSRSLAGCMFSCTHILSCTKNITCHLDELLISFEEMFSFSVVIFSQQTWCNVEGIQCGFADQRLTSQVHEIVGRINGRFGTLTFMPIHHLASLLSFSSISLSSIGIWNSGAHLIASSRLNLKI